MHRYCIRSVSSGTPQTATPKQSSCATDSVGGGGETHDFERFSHQHGHHPSRGGTGHRRFGDACTPPHPTTRLRQHSYQPTSLMGAHRPQRESTLPNLPPVHRIRHSVEPRPPRRPHHPGPPRTPCLPHRQQTRLGVVTLAMDRDHTAHHSRAEGTADAKESRRVPPLWVWISAWVALSLFLDFVNRLRGGSLLP